MFTVFMGYDPREKEAFEVARQTLLQHAQSKVYVVPLRLDYLKQRGLMWRNTERRTVDGKTVMWDTISEAPMATEFAFTRFLVPTLCQFRWALFVDCDVVIHTDIHDILARADNRKAIHVVKHNYQPSTKTKMDGQPQLAYRRKNWSSVMLWNCHHRAHQRLTLGMINSMPGRALHQFCWLDDEDIGDLDPGWNYLVDEQERPDKVYISHFTLGGPWLPGWEPRESDKIWLEAQGRRRREIAGVE